MKRLALLGLVVLLPACAGGDRSAPPPAAPARPAAPAQPAPAAPPSPAARGAVPAGFSPRSVSFVNERHGWVLGATGTTAAVVETRDGGRTWSLAGTLPVEVAEGTGRGDVRRIRFVSERDGWVYGRVAYVTRDGGATWRAAALPGGRTMVSIDVEGGETYALLGRAEGADVVDAAVWKAPAGGTTFRRLDARASVTWHDDLVVRGRTVLFRVDWTEYRVSNDSGRTWASRRPCPRDQGIRHLAAATEHVLVFSCVSGEHTSERSLRVSADGGRTTTTRLAESNVFAGGLVAAASPSSLTRALDPQFVADDRSTLQWSGDGGRTFRGAGPPPPQDSATESWSEPRFHAGAFGTIVRSVGAHARHDAVYATRDGGRTWVRLAIG